jgi:hypothetical protein
MDRIGGIGGVCALAFGVVWGCASAPFLCSSDDDCAGLAGGACEASGYCSVPDPDCPSMRRHAPHSGPLSNQCVSEDVADGGATEASDTGVGHGSEGSTTLVATSTGSVDDTSGSTGGLAAELVLHLPFDEALEGSSGAADIGPFGLDATCSDVACPTSVAGVVGGAARFDGSQRLEVAGAGPLDLTDGLTIAVWVRDLAPDPLATRVIFSRLVGDGFAASYELEFFDSTITCAVATADDQTLASVPYEPDPTAPWMHLAVVVDGASLRLYRDAELVASSEGAVVGYQDSALIVGADEDAGDGVNDYFIGDLDELQIFARPLAPAELEELVASMR